jgi:hypothetical protein
MNIFKPTTFTWWQLGMLKWAVMFIGIAVGATWPEVFSPQILLTLLGIALAFSLYLGVVWWREHLK